MPTLYYFQHSPFSRRTRLALLHKGVDVELKEAGQRRDWLTEARSLVPTRTLPIFVDGARTLGDSNAIARWLDVAYPHSPRLWPSDADDALLALDVAALTDVVLNVAADLGTRYFALRGDAAWDGVKGEMLGRAQSALAALAARVPHPARHTVAATGWSAADMWLFTAVAWLEGLPARVTTSPNAAQIVTLGLQVPDALSRWADAHRDRSDVRSLG